jgi:hypothetical protein
MAAEQGCKLDKNGASRTWTYDERSFMSTHVAESTSARVPRPPFSPTPAAARAFGRRARPASAARTVRVQLRVRVQPNCGQADHVADFGGSVEDAGARYMHFYSERYIWHERLSHDQRATFGLDAPASERAGQRAERAAPLSILRGQRRRGEHARLLALQTRHTVRAHRKRSLNLKVAALCASRADMDSSLHLIRARLRFLCALRSGRIHWRTSYYKLLREPLHNVNDLAFGRPINRKTFFFMVHGSNSVMSQE